MKRLLVLLLLSHASAFAEDSWLCTTEKFVGYIYAEENGFKEINFDPTKYTIKKTTTTAQGTQAEEAVYGFFGQEGGKPYSTGKDFNDKGVLIMDGWFKVVFNPVSNRFSMVDIGGYALGEQFKQIPTSLGMGKCVKNKVPE